MDESAHIQPIPKVGLIIADITKLMDDVEQMLSDSTSHHAEDQVELLRERSTDLRRRVAAFCVGVGQKISAGARQTDRTIRARPYQSLAVALGAGLVIGMVIGRNNS